MAQEPSAAQVGVGVYTGMAAELLLRKGCPPATMLADLKLLGQFMQNVLKVQKKSIHPLVIAALEKLGKDTGFRVERVEKCRTVEPVEQYATVCGL